MHPTLAHTLKSLDAMCARGEEPAPDWVAFPDLPFGSLGWRMGAGEEWALLVRCWVERLSESERLLWLKRHPPAPAEWEEVAVALLIRGDEGDEERYDAAVETLTAAGVLLQTPQSPGDVCVNLTTR